MAERLLRGAPGSSVKLGILRAGADPFDVTVVRERLVAAAPTGKLLDDGVGYVKVAEFTPTTAEDVRTQVEALKKGGARSFVLDLRSAAWGAPAEAAKVAEIFLQGGPVAKLVGRRQPEQLLQADASRQAWTGRSSCSSTTAPRAPARSWPRRSPSPTARSSSASTRSAAPACRSRCRCPRAGLLVTTAKYVSPKGNAIHGEGLKPTVPVDERTDEDDDLPADAPRPDRVLDKALELLKTGAAETKKAAA